MASTYSEKLRDPRWQRKRLEIMRRDNYCCQACLSKDIELHIHHKEYKWGARPWEYPDENFITYCKFCHEIVEWMKKNSFILIQTVHFGPTDCPALTVALMRRSATSDYEFYFIRRDSDGALDFSFSVDYNFPDDLKSIFLTAEKLQANGKGPGSTMVL